MNLHHNKEVFEELITAAASELHIPPNIIEKDYYVTLALKELSNRIRDMVFKGPIGCSGGADFSNTYRNTTKRHLSCRLQNSYRKITFFSCLLS